MAPGQMACSTGCSHRSRCPDDGPPGGRAPGPPPSSSRDAGPPVALTGRAALAALAGTLVVLALRDVAALIVVNALLGAAIAADVLLAADVRQLRLSRHGDTRIALGNTGSGWLTIENPGGRVLRAVIRDAWVPSAGALPGTWIRLGSR